ncbi:Aste57867_11063 [Aphanomyces stellatus]|uniref:Aste57867_11063 protein n=1 Tax=Aphanomyces stellatus TaxID=120398 RepID=A0A485KRW7_9STRA|nr:hypothetical protein As57867_011021 [Aphanomyces stellatus]VFT87931.1 Aste57867_11063 [Aphanomyces stellatus]
MAEEDAGGGGGPIDVPSIDGGASMAQHPDTAAATAHRKKKEGKARKRRHEKQQHAAVKIQAQVRGRQARQCGHYTSDESETHLSDDCDDAPPSPRGLALSPRSLPASVAPLELTNDKPASPLGSARQAKDQPSLPIDDRTTAACSPRSSPSGVAGPELSLLPAIGKQNDDDDRRATSSASPSPEKKEVVSPRVGLKPSASAQKLPPLVSQRQDDAKEAIPQTKSCDTLREPLHSTELNARAVKIQAAFRGLEGRHEAARQRQAMEDQLRREAEEELAKEEYAAVGLQALYRGHRVRTCLHLSHDEGGMPSKAEEDSTNVPVTTLAKESSAPMPSEAKASPNNDDKDDVKYCKDDDEEDKPREWPTPLSLNSHRDVTSDTTADLTKRGTVRVFVMTWNLQAQKPPADLRALLRPATCHIYAIGTEECVQTIAKSVLFQSKKEWEDLLRETLGAEYQKLRSHALTAMHNVVFVHKSVLPLVSELHSDAIATGLGNQLGNKGGVGIGFVLGVTSFAFVGCHFEAHQSQQALARRNANFDKINAELQLVAASESVCLVIVTRLTRVASDHRKGPIADTFDRVFWCGDLNYRIDGNRRMIDDLLQRNFHDVLLVNDQLKKEMHAGRVFQRFHEGPLHFRPTYKFDKGCDIYDTSPKQRIPSWTDRILFLSKNPKAIDLRAYESHMDIKTSDHRPVTAIFDVAFVSEAKATERTPVADQTKSEVCVLQ